MDALVHLALSSVCALVLVRIAAIFSNRGSGIHPFLGRLLRPVTSGRIVVGTARAGGLAGYTFLFFIPSVLSAPGLVAVSVRKFLGPLGKVRPLPQRLTLRACYFCKKLPHRLRPFHTILLHRVPEGGWSPAGRPVEKGTQPVHVLRPAATLSLPTHRPNPAACHTRTGSGYGVCTGVGQFDFV